FPSRVAIELLNQDPTLRGLLPFVLPMRSSRGRGQYTALQRLPTEFFDYVSGDNAAIEILVFVLRTAKGMEEQISVGDLSEKILNEVPRIRWIYVLEFISNSPFFAEDRAIRLLELCCDLMRRQDAA